MTQTASTIVRTPALIVGSLLLAGAVFVACAEGTSETTAASTTGSGGGSSSGEGGSGGESSGDGGGAVTQASSTSTTSTTSTGGDGGSGDGGGSSDCGNNVCDPGESCASCPNDCTTNCGAVCGDDSCQNPETCQTCPDDCLECMVVCGDGACAEGEPETCPQDCTSSGSGGAGCPEDVCTAGGTWSEECAASGDMCMFCVIFSEENCVPPDWSQECADAANACGAFGACACP